ncbi:hypothetical protein HDU96_007471 [Phlyctochytrium bullatum]|nr:hypothetical protein HDU96_007471 [Phlyctochytrium bullatum]
MVDCSHGNSQKQFKRQIEVAAELAEQIAAPGSTTANAIRGVMIESHLVEGRQDIPKNPTEIANMVYGKSVTDACIGWEDTVKVLDVLRDAVKRKRENRNRME